MRTRSGAAWGAVLAVVLAGCGYRAVTPFRARGGVERVHVRAFENDSADPQLAAAVTAALRDELARRGAHGAPDSPAQLDGVVRVTSGVGSSYTAATAVVAVEVRARLSVNGKLVQELTVRSGREFPQAVALSGADPVESEGRRATVLRKMARDAAQEVLRQLEAGEAPARAKPRG